MTVSPIRLCVVALLTAIAPIRAQHLVAAPYSKTGIYRINETELLYFGPRTPATVRELDGMLHPAPAR